MSKRSPFWHPFATQTPLGYTMAGFFNTEPGVNYGSLRITHVDGALPRPYISPGIPALPQPGRAAAAPAGEAALDLRAVERLDGTTIAFYPLFDGDGALVEVVPRTPDSAVVVDAPWRPLAMLVGQARHAGIEEAVRRQRGVFVFSLVGTANPRIVHYPYRLRLVLRSVLRGTGRVLGTYMQVRGWANQYGLELPHTYDEFDPGIGEAALAANIDAILRAIDEQARDAALGQLVSSGAVLWASERGGAALLDLPAQPQPSAELNPILVWDAMARLADQGIAPTLEAVTATPLLRDVDADRAALHAAWEAWARTYPQAFPAAQGARMAV